MNYKEKNFLKRNLITIIGIIIVFTIIWFVCGKVMGNRFTDYMFRMDNEKQYNELEPDQLRIKFDRDDAVRLESVVKENGRILYNLCPLESGMKSGDFRMSVYHAETGEELTSDAYRVWPSGIIMAWSTGNYTNCQVHHLLLFLFCLVLAIELFYSFCYVQKVLRYSYQAIFFSGLSIWMFLICILLFNVWYMQYTMWDVYVVLKNAASEFMLFSFPFVVLFCIALSVSNIQLIRKEGFRTRNALGICISVVMFFGIVVYFGIYNTFSSGSDLQVKTFSAIIGIYSSIYAFMECFLIGSIICGALAAKHEPEYDMDYLIILGCKVKPDGGLYPLIQARVDRAIEFYQKQLKKTGKKAIFVPSGGQGSDETIAEADAMKRYLIEQGIPMEQILVENQSKNTVENMLFSKRIIQERTPEAKVAFSSTNYHVFRSGIISRQNQFEPDGMGSKTKWYFWPNAFIREVIGMMVYKRKSIVIVLLPIIIFLIAIQYVG